MRISFEDGDGLDMVRVGKEIECPQLAELVPRIREGRGISRESDGIARDVDGGARRQRRDRPNHVGTGARPGRVEQHRRPAIGVCA